jgi:hypothetical protein
MKQMTDINYNRDERIKIEAFYIWLDEGCPDGQRKLIGIWQPNSSQ